nr:hypothetical protein [uncultured Cellulosilyticum sp.]
MENKEIYMKLLLYASYLLMFIGGVRIVVVLLNRLMMSLSMSVLIFVAGVLFFTTYKNLSNK